MTEETPPDVLFDHYTRFLRAPIGREIYRADGFDQSIQTLRFDRVFHGCVTIATIGFGRLVAAYSSDFVEVVMAVDDVPRPAEHLLVQTLFAAATNQIPLREGISVGGQAAVNTPFVEATGKAAFYFTEPVPFPPEFRRPDVGSRLLLAMPISQAEHEHVKARGGGSLEERLEASGADPISIGRPSVC